MRRLLPAAALAAALLAAPVAAAPATVPEGLAAADPTTGERVPLAGGAKVVHLVFFATWCRPCLDELPRLADLEARWPAQDYRLLLIAVPTRQTPERLQEFVRERKPPGRVLLDTGGAVGRALGVDGVPTHLVVDSSGRIVAQSERVQDGIFDAIVRSLRGGNAEPRP